MAIVFTLNCEGFFFFFAKVLNFLAQSAFDFFWNYEGKSPLLIAKSTIIFSFSTFVTVRLSSNDAGVQRCLHSSLPPSAARAHTGCTTTFEHGVAVL